MHRPANCSEPPNWLVLCRTCSFSVACRVKSDPHPLQTLPSTTANASLTTPVLAAIAVAAVFTGTNARAQGVISVDTDSATQFSGTFSATGYGSTSSNPSVFPGLPNGSILYLERAPVFNVLQPLQAGTPQNPFYHVGGDAGPTSLSGSYSNGGASQDRTVTWSFTSLQDTTPGAFGGTFTGSFSFSIGAVPEPAETALAIGTGLGFFALARRSRRNASPRNR